MGRMGRMMIVALAVLMSTVSVMARPQIYVKGSYAGTETGTYAQPFNTLSEAQTAAATGDTINLYPEVYRDALGASRYWVSTGKNVTIRTTPSSLTGVAGTRARISGAVGVLASEFVNVTTDVWYFTVTDATKVSAVTVDYYTTIKPTAPCIGAFGGYYTEVNTGVPATDITTVTNTAIRWTIDAGATPDRVYVRIPGTGSTPPVDNRVEWVRLANLDAISLITTTGSVVSGIDFDRLNTRSTDGATGKAVVITNGVNCTVSNCTAQSTGDGGFVSTATGTGAATGNTFKNLTTWCSGPVDPDSAGVTLYNEVSSGAGLTSTGHRVNDCTVHLAGLYTPSYGVLPPRPTGITGWSGGYGTSPLRAFSVHVAAAGTQAFDDIEWNRCVVDIDPQFFIGSAAAAYQDRGIDWYVTGTLGVNGSPWEAANYPCRVVECSTTGGMGNTWQVYSCLAFDRCALTHDAAKSSDLFRYNTQLYGVFQFASASNGPVHSAILWSGCDVENNNKATSTNDYGTLSMGPNTSENADRQWYIVKTTVRDTSQPNSTQRGIMFVPANNVRPGTSAFFAEKSAFIWTKDSAGTAMAVDAYRRFAWNASYTSSTYTLGSLPGAPELKQQLRFGENLYYGCPTTGTSNGGFTAHTGGSTLNTTATLHDAAEFCSSSPALGIDRRGVTGTNPLLIAPETSARPGAGSPLSVRRSDSHRHIKGINNRIGNCIGAWQDEVELLRPVR